MHCVTKDLAKALGPYQTVIAAYRHTKESGYARSQIQNIVNSVVPEHELFEELSALAVSRLQTQGPPSGS